MEHTFVSKEQLIVQLEELLRTLRGARGVIKAEILAG